MGAARLQVPAGVALHPSFVYEIVFHALAFVVLWRWLRHDRLPAGETLTVYVGAYAVFRLLVEFVRGNEVVWHGLTRPQLVLLATLPVLLLRLTVVLRRRESAMTSPARIPQLEAR